MPRLLTLLQSIFLPVSRIWQASNSIPLSTQQSHTIQNIENLTRSGTWSYDQEAYSTKPSNQTPDSSLIKDWRISRETGEYLYRLIINHKPGRALELGTSTGYSALWIGSALATYGGHLDTVEYFDLKIPIAKGFINEAGLNDVVTVHHSRIREHLQNIGSRVRFAPQDNNQTYNFVFMDADKTNYRSYWELLRPLLAPNAIVIADNATNYAQSMSDWVSYCRSDVTLHCEHIDIGSGLFVVHTNH